MEFCSTNRPILTDNILRNFANFYFLEDFLKVSFVLYINIYMSCILSLWVESLFCFGFLVFLKVLAAID
jgi:hypothetical protein